ncbi:hypothetical protein P170DRAFT_363782 [Aspergillus steynii IBT 23096]|uniref:Myb-like domain-containing protein n=1 Tax=Aspergillus steynii IBT 23096 TaxID=1392250 RepID=A0A2I2FYF7_9EURO|nr:uncharacterized protein P170DRAFT_363782 [Aspergillus steynii IBT 23096]PLB45664.1 hypothetical protein P170DRAFT_363782 [Aspergillus steynii IBT 23096]
MYPQTPCGYTGPMSYGHGVSTPGEGMDNFYDMQSQWSGVDTSPYGGVNHPYTSSAAFQSSAILTPISLPDSSFAHARPSPVLSHHSQEYQYGMSEPIPHHHGLGITAPFPSDFPRTVTAGFGHPVDDSEYGFSEGGLSPQPPSAKRARRSPKYMPQGRETPVTILPHPEGLQRLEQERRQGHVEPHPHQRPRAPGRGRRDPQAEEEDAFVERLREQNLAWKVIREMFREKFNKDASEARLQMRMLRRRKERLARWDENDIQLLIKAREYWEHEKYELIAEKMREFGSRKSYSAQQCEAQLRYLDTQNRDRGNVPLPRMTDPQHARRRAMLKASRGTAANVTNQ